MSALKLTVAQRRLLSNIAGGFSYGWDERVRRTYNSLERRGFIRNDLITDAGRAVLEASRALPQPNPAVAQAQARRAAARREGAA